MKEPLIMILKSSHSCWRIGSYEVMPVQMWFSEGWGSLPGQKSWWRGRGEFLKAKVGSEKL